MVINMEEWHFELDCDTTKIHLHDELEIIYVLAGRIAVMQSDGNILLNPEDFVVLNPFEYHELYKEAGNHTLSFYISLDILKKCGLAKIMCCSCTHVEQAEYISLIRTKLASIFKNYLDNSQMQKVYILSQIYGLLAILKQQFETEASESTRINENEKLRDALLFINENVTENITLSDVAEHAFISKSHLSRVFHKEMKKTFSDYLKELRVRKAENLLQVTDQTIMDISVNCGYTNCNTFIANFKDIYAMTPGEYRKKQKPAPESNAKRFTEGKMFYSRLLKHAAVEEVNQTLAKRVTDPVIVHTDVRKERGELDPYYRDEINIGWAKDILLENVQKSIIQAVKDIGFEYISFYGILDDAMDVYHEDENGAPWFSFTYIDIILNFILSIGAKPNISLGFTPLKLQKEPQNLFGASCVQLPSYPDKWKMLVKAFFEHITYSFGMEKVQSWRFGITPALYCAYDVFSMEEYLEYYKETYFIIQKYLQHVQVFGGLLDAEFTRKDKGRKLQQFIEFTKRNHCMPEEFCFQSFGVDYSQCDSAIIEKKIISRTNTDYSEPAPPSTDENLLKDQIRFIREILDRNQCEDRRIRFEAWNSTMWQRDLGNDTCFKAAFIVKNYIENMGNVSALSYCYLTDHTELRISNSNIYHGGYGLITYQGISKAAYGAYWMLSRLGSIWMQRGVGYIVTKSTNEKEIQILLYHYCHYDMENHVSQTFSNDEQRTIDRYYEFRDQGVKNFRIYITGLSEGDYDKESYIVNRESGSSYDKWMEIGSPENISAEQRMVLEQGNMPGYKYERIKIDSNGELLVSAVLDAHEIRLIQIRKK